MTGAQKAWRRIHPHWLNFKHLEENIIAAATADRYFT
jgi:hypothetical protein